MAQNKLPDVAPRTIRVHLPTYNAILEFFRLSPSGLRGSDAIRQVLMQFGRYCEKQMREGRTASTKDLLEAEKTFHRIMGELPADDIPDTEEEEEEANN